MIAILKQSGRGDRIRTCDIYVPNVALYQSELHPGYRVAYSPGSLIGRRLRNYGTTDSPASLRVRWANKQ